MYFVIQTHFGVCLSSLTAVISFCCFFFVCLSLLFSFDTFFRWSVPLVLRPSVCLFGWISVSIWNSKRQNKKYNNNNNSVFLLFFVFIYVYDFFIIVYVYTCVFWKSEFVSFICVIFSLSVCVSYYDYFFYNKSFWHARNSWYLPTLTPALWLNCMKKRLKIRLWALTTFKLL